MKFTSVDLSNDVVGSGKLPIEIGSDKGYTTVDALSNAAKDYLEDKVVSVGGLLLTDTVWDDIRITSGGFELTGNSDPYKVNWQPGGAGAIFKMWEFAKDDYVCVSAQMPHGYKAGSALKVHAHWTPGSRGNEERNSKVGWKCDITAAGYGSVFPATQTLDISDTVPANCLDHQHLISSSVSFVVPAGFKESGIVVMRVYRSDTGADDTWISALSGSLPLLLEIDIHYEIDKIGSSDEIPT